MSTPRPWRQDPERIRETGIDLDDEAALGGYDLAAIKAGVAARTGGGGGGGGGWGPGPWIAGGTGAVALLTVALWSAGSPGTPAAIAEAPAPGEAAALASPVPIGRSVDAVAPRTAQAVATPVSPPIARDPVAPRPAAAPRAGSGTSEAGAIAAAVAAIPDDPAPSDPIVAPPPEAPGTADAPAASSDLADQLATYSRGQDALAAGDNAAAGAAFQEYLARWPDGQLRDEVLVSVLDLLVRAEQWQSVADLTRDLLGISTLSARRAELVRVRAEALVHLGRCDEALALADGLASHDATSVRKACRTGLAR